MIVWIWKLASRLAYGIDVKEACPPVFVYLAKVRLTPIRYAYRLGKQLHLTTGEYDVPSC